MIDADFEDFLMLMRNHTALGRISLAELIAAFEVARQNGYSIRKSDVAGVIV